jgi:prepilin-type N-terminal cleavage/methylation domain-containing protein
MRRLSDERGFTLIEVLVSTLLVGIVFGATLTMLESFQTQSSAAVQRNETEDLARSAIDRLGHELRSTVASSTTSAGALEQAEPYSVTFQIISSSTVFGGENANNAMRMRYCLDDSNPKNEALWLQTLTWKTKTAPALATSTACPDETPGDWTSSTRLVQNVTNRIGGQERSLFTYAPASASSVSEIVSVTPSLYTDLTPGGLRSETQLTTTIGLRNENRKPTASFTAVQSGAFRAVLLNASESLDPDGLSLTYKWWDNGALMSSSSQQFETKSNNVGETHAYKLEVVDPGGLSATAEHTVTIE